MENWSRIFSPADLGLAIQAARMGKGWSQRELSQRTGIAQSAISDLESGKHTLYAERLFTLLQACEIGLKAEWRNNDDPDR